MQHSRHIRRTLPMSQVRLDAGSCTCLNGDMSNPFRRHNTPVDPERAARIKAARQAALSIDRFADNRFATPAR